MIFSSIFLKRIFQSKTSYSLNSYLDPNKFFVTVPYFVTAAG